MMSVRQAAYCFCLFDIPFVCRLRLWPAGATHDGFFLARTRVCARLRISSGWSIKRCWRRCSNSSAKATAAEPFALRAGLNAQASDGAKTERKNRARLMARARVSRSSSNCSQAVSEISNILESSTINCWNSPFLSNGARRSLSRVGWTRIAMRERSSDVIVPSATISSSTAFAWSNNGSSGTDSSSVIAGTTTTRRPPGRSSRARKARKVYQSWAA